MTPANPPPARRDHAEPLAKPRAAQDTVSARSLALVCRELFREPNALLAIGRFELVRTLGRGGNGVVYEARDPVRGEHVALKVLHGRGPTQLFRLKREFRALAGLSHPNLVALHELSIDDGEPYFSMELVRGRDFTSYARHGAAQGEPIADHARLRDALAQLCEGVRALHGDGKLHRDLKPTNVLVNDSGHVVLLDFGLVDDARGSWGQRAGTPGYMAPEQARGRPCEASDWYAFGRVLQEALRGRSDERAGASLPGRLSEGFAALEQLADKLLHPQPTLRPGYAEIMAVLRGGAVRPAHPRALRAHRAAPFIGRDAELRRLEHACARSRQQPVLVLVRGARGAGKSALLERFASRAREASGARVLSGRCYAGESVPYRGLDGVIDALSMELMALGAQASALRPADSALLPRVFPVLGRVSWLSELATTPENVQPVELRARAFGALRELLARLAADRPLVLQIDDLHWSDADTGRLLGALTCDERAPALLIVATDAGDPREPCPTLDELRSISDLSPYPLAIEPLELHALGAAEASQLAHRLLEGASLRRASEIARESRGNPLLLIELTRWISDTRCDRGGELPALGALLAERMRSLTPASRQLLSSIALAGRALPIGVLARALGRSELHTELAELRRVQLVQAIRRGTEDAIGLTHDRLAEAVLQDVGDAERVRSRVRLAQAFEVERGEGGDAPVELYLAANMPLEAAECARRAAATALSTLAFARAAELYRRALELGAWGRGERAELLRELGRALEHDGRGIAAASAYLRAAKRIAEPVAAAELWQRAAKLLMHNGRFRSGEALLRRGYGVLGIRWPSKGLPLLLAIVWRLAPLGLRRLIDRGDRPSAALRRARATFLTDAGRGLDSYDILRAIHNSLVCFDESEQLADPAWRARAQGSRGIMRYFFAHRSSGKERGLAELKDACRASARLGDAAAEADLQGQLATACFFDGRPREALVAARRSEACWRTLPFCPTDFFPVMGIAGAALVDLGELREARRFWSTVAYEARVHGDLVASTFVRANPLQLAPLFAAEEHKAIQQILDRQAQLNAQHPGYRWLAWAHAACRVEHALRFGTGELAVRLFSEHEAALLRSGYPFLTAAGHLIRARARLAAACALPRGRARAGLLRGAERDASKGSDRSGAVQHGKALLVQASVALQRSRRDLAVERLDGALAIFEAVHAKLLADAARHCKGALLGGQIGTQLKRAAEAGLRAEDVASPARWVAWTVAGFGDEPKAET